MIEKRKPQMKKGPSSTENENETQRYHSVFQNISIKTKRKGKDNLPGMAPTAANFHYSLPKGKIWINIKTHNFSLFVHTVHMLIPNSGGIHGIGNELNCLGMDALIPTSAKVLRENLPLSLQEDACVARCEFSETLHFQQ
jgi:hypothetical protein